MISISIDRLVKKFGDNVALNEISFRVEPGELFFLLGPSGCGKTTLLRNIAGFYIPDSGRVLFQDTDVTRLPPHKRNTGMMFQSYALWPHMTVAQNVAFGLEERKVAKGETTQRVKEALASVRMEAYAERKIAQLSGGQQQRVALARALVIRPQALLLDEPLSNLDAKLRLEMRTEIRRVCKEFGLTAIYVTHDQKEALSISDRMAILDKGKVAQVGSPTEVYRRPSSRVVADFIGETNFISGKVLFADGKKVQVETELGNFSGIRSENDWQPQAGEKVSLSIRPESWKIKEQEPESNYLKGRVRDSVYLGEVAQYDYYVGEQHVKIFELNPHLEARAQDRDLFAEVHPLDVVVLRK
ncbi:MAG: ABC transporter ATP-binding protein [Chthoniobacterales bacterium]